MNDHYSVLVFAFGTLILIVFVFTLILFLITHKKKRYQHLLEKQQMENNYRNQLLLSRLEVQEQSFKYFSEEIHDNIGQLLSIVKMQLYNIKNNSKEPEIINKATNSTNLLGKAITDLRNISHALNNAFVDKAGLEAAIQKDLDYVCSAKELHCSLHKTGEEYDLGSERELLIFRIVQEAITNAIKHAAPTAINITLHYEPHIFSVSIKDNGTGFDAGVIADAGLGLTNMHERARLLNGELHIDSNKGNGTEITLSIKNTAGHVAAEHA